MAMDGDVTTGMLIGETQAFPGGVRYGQHRVGGTNLSSPLFAALSTTCCPCTPATPTSASTTPTA